MNIRISYPKFILGLIVILLSSEFAHAKIETLTPVTFTSSVPEIIETDLAFIPFTDSKSGLMGYKNTKGKIVINPKFKMAREFTIYKTADVWMGDTNWFKIDQQGNIITQSLFFDNGPDYFVLGLNRIQKDNKIGFANYHGKVIIPAQYDWASPFMFSTPIAIVCIGCKEFSSDPNCDHKEFKGGKWGAINKQGHKVVPLIYDGYKIENNQVVFNKADRTEKLFIDSTGQYKLITASRS